MSCLQFTMGSAPMLHKQQQTAPCHRMFGQRLHSWRLSPIVARIAQSERPDMLTSEPSIQLPSILDLTSNDVSSTSASQPAAASAEQQQRQSAATQQRIQRALQRKREQLIYKVSAIAATTGITSIAVVATYLRFSRHMGTTQDLPLLEMVGTLALVFGGVIGMEMWARFAHRELWHDYAPGWALHKSHHEPRTGPFEANDIFAVMNAVPAMGLCMYGFFTPNMSGGLAFGAGLGITLFGIMYMFFHDGLVHRRFPVGPIAELPYMKRIAVAHQIHHTNKFGGVPFGMFLGPQELEAVPGGREELDRLVAQQTDFGKK